MHFLILYSASRIRIFNFSVESKKFAVIMPA